MVGVPLSRSCLPGRRGCLGGTVSDETRLLETTVGPYRSPVTSGMGTSPHPSLRSFTIPGSPTRDLLLDLSLGLSRRSLGRDPEDLEPGIKDSEPKG